MYCPSTYPGTRSRQVQGGARLQEQLLSQLGLLPCPYAVVVLPCPGTVVVLPCPSTVVVLPCPSNAHVLTYYYCQPSRPMQGGACLQEQLLPQHG